MKQAKTEKEVFMKNFFMQKLPLFFKSIGKSISGVFGTCLEACRKLIGKIALKLRLLIALDKKKKLMISACSAAVVIAAVLLIVLIPGNDRAKIEKEVTKAAEAAVETVEEAAEENAMQINVQKKSEPVQSEEKEVALKISLKAGDTDEEVVPTVQERLIELDYMDNDETTAEYSEVVAEAVALFQRRCEQESTGILDATTYTLLFSDAAPTYMAQVGDSGGDVIAIQERLIELDYLRTDSTGYFGTDTEEAVKKFQQNNKLTDDGKVGRLTKEAIYSDDVVPNYSAYGEESEEVKQLQKRLKKLGYLNTEPDGKFGNDTLVAVKQFQVQHDLIADGWIGPQTKNLLLSADAKYNTISYGMDGSYVTKIQERLRELNYLKSSATGYFGTDTQDAVALFQQQYGLARDGKVGQYTMSLLMDPAAKKAPSTVTENRTDKTDKNNDKKNDKTNNDKKNDKKNDKTNNDKKNDKTEQKVDPPSYSGEASVSKLLKIAKSKLGTRYVRGGKGSNKFDCSGYVYWCLNQTGVKVNYMTSATWQRTNKFKRIKSMNDMKAGDIISMRGHVAIYAGNGMMYDASSSKGKVVYREAFRPWVKKDFVCAYRVFS